MSENKSAESVELLPKDCVADHKNVLSGLARHIIELEECGPISVYIQGDLDKGRDGPVFMTIHNVGSSFQSMVEFVNHVDMDEVKQRCLFLHVSVYGQSHQAEDLPIAFPSLQKIGMGLVTVLDELRIQNVVVLGDGAGANIALRFGLCHPTRVEGLVLINGTATEGSTSFMEAIMDKLVGTAVPETELKLNQNNVAKYDEAFKARTNMLQEIPARINFDVLLMSGLKSRFCEEAHTIYTNIKPGLASIIKVDDVADPLTEAQEKIIDAIILFCQGLGHIPTVQRKMSRSSSINSMEGASERPAMQRRISMEQYDTPNLRRLSLTSK